MKLALTILATVTLHLTILLTPALAQEPPRPPKTVTVVVMQPAVVRPCVARPLEQGSGSVRVCPGGQL